MPRTSTRPRTSAGAKKVIRHPIHLKDVDLGQAPGFLARFDKLRRQYQVSHAVSPVAKAFQALLEELGDRDLGAFHGNMLVVERINQLRDLLGLDLFVDKDFTQQVRLSCVAPQSGYPNGRWDIQFRHLHPGKSYRAKSYSKTFPLLYLGQRVYKRPF